MSSMYHMLSQVICLAFEKEVGKRSEGKGLHVCFAAQVDYSEVEDGYRWYDLFIYAPSNYVQVWVRRRWDIRKVGQKKYDAGAEEWTLLADHDSCWRDDGVRRFLMTNEKSIVGFAGLGDTFYKIGAPFEGHEEAYKKARARRGY